MFTRTISLLCTPFTMLCIAFASLLAVCFLHHTSAVSESEIHTSFRGLIRIEERDRANRALDDMYKRIDIVRSATHNNPRATSVGVVQVTAALQRLATVGFNNKRISVDIRSLIACAALRATSALLDILTNSFPSWLSANRGGVESMVVPLLEHVLAIRNEWPSEPVDKNDAIARQDMNTALREVQSRVIDGAVADATSLLDALFVLTPKRPPVEQYFDTRLYYALSAIQRIGVVGYNIQGADRVLRARAATQALLLCRRAYLVQPSGPVRRERPMEPVEYEQTIERECMAIMDGAHSVDEAWNQ